QVNERINKLLDKMRQAGLDALLVTGEINVRYLTGFTGDSTYLVVSEDTPILLSDGRYESQIASQCPGFDVRIRSPSDLLPDLTRDVIQSVKGDGTGVPRVGLESNQLTLSSYRRLVSGISQIEFVETASVVEELRMIKDDSEIEITRRAVRIAQDAFSEVIKEIRGDWTELDVVYALEGEMRSRGAEGCSFNPIVGAGPGAALPHYQPQRRLIGGGNGLLIDWGALVEGYASDLTRTLRMSASTPAFDQAHHVVLEAQMAAIETIRPGASTQSVDQAARQVLRKHGMEEAFKHGLGHGIGLFIHESPRMSAVGDDTLQSGMIVTVEPGVYFDGDFGIRIEDDVLVTETGYEVLSDLPKGLEDHQLLL
ncbi:MAG: Xaa-Pro peptidase family protein, partial [Planctomycetota bacterium]|nr:Xaa-Pro peptidase family protein [Planctomycetota bacterium]